MEEKTFDLIQKNINELANMNLKLIKNISAYPDLTLVNPDVIREARENAQALVDLRTEI